MRLPYISDPPPSAPEEDHALVERIRQRRGPSGLIPLDRTLLHSPPIADGWNTLFAAIRTRTSLPPAAVELVIVRVAVLNRAWYEFEHHAPLLLDAGFPRETGLRYVFTAAPFEHASPTAEGEVAVLDERALALLAYTDYSTLRVAVPEGVVGRLLGAGFTERQVFEVAAVCAGYNCVSRVLVGLDVSERNGRGGMEAAIRAVGLGDVLGGLEPVRVEGREDW